MEDKLKSYYKEKFGQFGHDEKSLGWSKNKQNIRFHNLIRFFKFKNSSLLDVGCGFGDLYQYINQNDLSVSSYTGIDLMTDFISIAKEANFDQKTTYLVESFEKHTNKKIKYDFIVASGIFGHMVSDVESDNYKYIEDVIKKSLEISKIGISFDFISDKVDFKTSDKDFHASPTKILEIAYKFSRNVILNNSSMPFEFNIVIFKDDSFKTDKTVFNQYINDFPNKENS